MFGWVVLIVPLLGLSSAASGDHRAHGALSRAQLAAYERDGVIVVRGLLTSEEAARAVEAAALIEKAKATLRSTHYSGLAFGSLQASPALRHAALQSRAPKVVAQLMAHEAARRRAGVGPRPVAGAERSEPPAAGDEEVRVLKDAFLSFVPGKQGCGWHRDDSYFWPCPENEVSFSPDRCPALRLRPTWTHPCALPSRLSLPLAYTRTTLRHNLDAPTEHPGH